jgi:hypothetical protein
MNALITKAARRERANAHARGFYVGVETARVDSGPSIFRLKTEVGATTYVKRCLICDSAIVRMGTIAAIELGGIAEGGRAQQFGGGVAGKELVQLG